MRRLREIQTATREAAARAPAATAHRFQRSVGGLRLAELVGLDEGELRVDRGIFAASSKPLATSLAWAALITVASLTVTLLSWTDTESLPSPLSTATKLCGPPGWPAPRRPRTPAT